LGHNNGTIDEFDKQEEAIAAVVELFLEYLRLSNPPTLERKENRFEYVKF